MVRTPFLAPTACAMGAPASRQAPADDDVRELFVLGADLSAPARMAQAGADVRHALRCRHR